MLENVSTILSHNIYEIKQQQKASKKKDNSGKIRAEMDRLNILYQKGRINDEYYDNQYEMLEKKLQEELEKNQIITLESYRPIIERFSGNWKELYFQLDYEHRNMFWRKYIKEINVDKETHKLCGFKFSL